MDSRDRDSSRNADRTHAEQTQRQPQSAYAEWVKHSARYRLDGDNSRTDDMRPSERVMNELGTPGDTQQKADRAEAKRYISNVQRFLDRQPVNPEQPNGWAIDREKDGSREPRER